MPLVILNRGYQVDKWVESERNHLLDRWAGLFRGQARCKAAAEVSAQDRCEPEM